MTVAEWGLLLLLSLLWGGSFFFSKIAVQEVPPFSVVLARVGIAAAALGLYLRVRRLSVPRSLSAWGAFAGMGALNNLIPFSLIFWGQTAIASGLASILNATTPVFSILVAHFLTTDEKLSANKMAGIVLGIAGVIALVGADALTGSGRSLLAMLACLGAALSYGFANVFGRRFRRMGVAPAVGAFGQITATAIMMTPIALVFDTPWRLPPPSAPVWAALVGLALLSTALAYVIFFRILARAGATNISLVTLLVPVSAILLGSVVLGERLSAVQLAGMALIGLGLVTIDGRVWNAGRLAGAPPRSR
ncbi:DMT family transporter [Limobrevibacterium gyesilva]|uniref:DMT family transporter n=1 Tax=Limobrevibacterium gyesilva TaxID=2991712 RepID=A0AA42CJA7_9PROT|nr:DMT family transporter [Limobrevibacterium gyesilva]MCW3476717.1 DMT family transporter [Limobrevibacterium gyesilva]